MSEMKAKYEVKKSCHGMPCIELIGVPLEEMRKLRSLVMNNWVNSFDSVYFIRYPLKSIF